ncbi:cytochrome C oxidase subunit IV family protein [bacterium]|nr:cytochrome C oxidase subunit IV family protein [bacterium]
MANVETEHHVVPNGIFVKVWVWLLILTAATVTASVSFPGKGGVLVAMIVTPVKAALILMFFMHLKYECTVYRIMLLVAVGILAVFMGLTFFDYSFRS